MKLNYLHISGFKNLADIEIHFEEDCSVSSIIGINGSGKSNILEAVANIFTYAVNNESPEDFLFRVVYMLDSNLIEIDNSSNKLSVTKNKKRVSVKDLYTVLPKSVFLYYAGETKRLMELAEGSIDTKFQRMLKNDNVLDFKYVTYLTAEDFGASFLTIYIYQNKVYGKICELLDIKGICNPITINLKRPSWGKRGDVSNFWNARGSVASILKSISEKGFFKVINKDKAQLIFEDISVLKDNTIGESGLFTIFTVLKQADVLESIEFDVLKGDSIFSYTHLSEGEKQLSHLLGALEITKEYKMLFLLDEFDSYMHPQWQRKFVEEVNQIDIRGQVLFTTHSPLTLGKMKKENIILIKEGVAYNPSSETYNRDITEVLEELMEVKKRPAEIEEMIYEFRKAVFEKNSKLAQELILTLQEVLSNDDPFFINARISLSRLER